MRHDQRPNTPPGAEAKLEAYSDALDDAMEKLRQARDDELSAKEDRDAAKRRAQLSPDCPKVGVFDGVRTTVAYQTAWIEDQIAEQEHDYSWPRSPGKPRRATWTSSASRALPADRHQVRRRRIQGTGRWSA